MNNVDIERLHRDTEKLFNGTLTARRSGKTTVILYQVLGAMEVAPSGSTVAVLVHSRSYGIEFSRLLHMLIDEYQIPLTMANRTEFLTKSGVHVIIITPDDVCTYNVIQGIRLFNFFVDEQEALRANNHTLINETIHRLNTRIL
jgi:hypothetical protein